MNPASSGVAICPKCGRTNGAPSSGNAFNCMFCGAQISQAGGATHLAPVPAGAPAARPILPIAGLERVYPWRKTRGSVFSYGLQTATALLCLVIGIYFWGDNWFQTLLYMAIFAGLFYFGLTGLFNATTVRLQGDRLEIHTSPLPWPRHKSLPVSEIRVLQVRKTRVKYGWHYHLTVEMATGRKIDLLSDFTRSAPLEELAGELNTYLGIGR